METSAAARLANHPAVEDVTPTGNGRINVYLAPGWWYEPANGDGLDAYTLFVADDAAAALAVLNDEERVYEVEQ